MAGARSAGARDRHSSLGPCPCPRVPPASPPLPVPAPCPPGTVIVQLLRGGGRSPGAVCVSKGLCGKITRAGGGGGGRREPTTGLRHSPTAMPGLRAWWLGLPSTGHPRGPMSCLRCRGTEQQGGTRWHGAAGWHSHLHPRYCKGFGCKQGAEGEQNLPPNPDRTGLPGTRHSPGCPNNMGAPCQPLAWPQEVGTELIRGALMGVCPGPGQDWTWGGSGTGGGGSLAGGQHSSGCRPISSSRGNKLRPKGAFERRAPCRAGVLLWQLMLNLAPKVVVPPNRAFPLAYFHRARSC